MVDCCSAPGLLPFEQALTNMLANVSPVQETEQVLIEKALGRVVSQPITSPLNVPPHNNSAMDGYAFAHSSLETSDQLKLAGRSRTFSR